MKKIISILLVVSMIFFGCVAYAVTGTQTGEQQVNQAVNDLNSGTGPYAVLKTVMGIMAWSGFMIAIFKVIQIGIMFMTGTAGKRSGAKDSIAPWLVGAIICATFGVVGPWIISILAQGDSGDIFSM